MRPSDVTSCFLEGGPENGATIRLQKYSHAYYVEGPDGWPQGTYHDTFRVVNGCRVFRYEEETL